MERGLREATLRIAAELEKPVPAGIYEIAAAIVRQHVSGVTAVLAYGSCIRDTGLDESLIDLYVLTRRPEDVSSRFFTRVACHLLPPNVYYAECVHSGRMLRSKYAVMPLREFAGRMGSNTRNPYFWARFAQPSRLVFAADDASRFAVLKAIVEASATMLEESRKLAKPGEDIFAALVRGLKASYATELRAEKSARAETIINSSRHYYAELASLFPFTNDRAGKAPAKQEWRRRKTIGKALSVARLIKAGFTFEGGADYLAWKIGRHSGEVLTMSSWHRRHPVLTGLMLLPKLLRKGTVR
ncbi:MAG TPA: hypothetical protein VET25_12930 [Aestuariivirgaceae bacterium]|nr:hypothetical protein [Aestuariivirgaceae bacterium]